MTASIELRVPKTLRTDVGQIIELTDGFCAEHLDSEYAHLRRHLAGKLARKRPSPLTYGDLRMWAAAILYTVGSANFLFDRTQTPHMRADDLATLTGVSKPTMSKKAGQVRRILGIDRLEPELCRRDVLDRHPYAWFVELDGLVVDARWLPEPLLEDARRRGLVPAR